LIYIVIFARLKINQSIF